ncbi:MAG: DUF547 domain-containing protein [Bacteroidota bacterium]
MKTISFLISAFLFFTVSSCAQNSSVKDAGFSHQAFENILQKYVSASGVVNYTGLKKDEASLDKYLATLSKDAPSKSWSKNASLAFWINTYNAFTIKLILKNYPEKSIQDINNGKPWDLQWINIGGKTYSLNNIENDIIRPQYKDPRIHFAVNCAAKSCPPLANKAFTENNINSMLDARAKNFINSNMNVISATAATVSKIFDWYKADFGNVISFINKYSNVKLNANATIDYKNYDWSLNGK